MRGLCWILGHIGILVLPKRRRQIISNLSHVFPKKGYRWCKHIAAENFSRLIELGALSLASGFLPPRKIRKSFSLSHDAKLAVKYIIQQKKGAIILIPHCTCMEAMTFFPLYTQENLPEIGVIYRPFKNASIEKFVRKTRERFGLKLLSRHTGVRTAFDILKQKGIVALLFDQNAGESGALTTCFQRITSTTELPCELQEKTGADVYFLYPKRIGFWRAKIFLKKLHFSSDDRRTIVFNANRYLEQILSSNDDTCADWLWAHNRWKLGLRTNLFQKWPPARKNWIESSLAYYQCTSFPRTWRVFLRLPNHLGDLVMTIPLLRMLRKSRPDAELSVLCQPHYIPFLRALHLVDHVFPLPQKNKKYFWRLLPYRQMLPDLYVTFINSLRGDMEAAIIGAPIRCGLNKKNSLFKPLFLTHAYKPPKNLDISSTHQTFLHQKMLEYLGITGTLDLQPFRFCTTPSSFYDKSIGIVCSSANEPNKRWPIDLWKILIERLFDAYKNLHINLYGTRDDIPLTEELAMFFNRGAVSNLAGQTTVLELAQNMQKENVIISIDTGGMHLASMFGCPLVCIFGITNPLVTGPVFNGPKTIVMPQSSPAKGGFPTEDVEVNDVFRAVQTFLK